MERLKALVIARFEVIFVLLILLSVALINYFVSHKFAFLNFYFIPVLLAAYFLSYRQTMVGAYLIITMVSLYAFLYRDEFARDMTVTELPYNLAAWGCFLLLTAMVVSKLQAQLRRRIAESQALNEELKANQTKLTETARELEEYSLNLEQKVQARTRNLREAKETVEALKGRVEEALHASMDPEVVKLIIERRLRNEKRRVSILFSDLKSFTRYSEDQRPEVVVQDLNRFLREMEEILLRYRAHIDKYIGDGIMAEFGAPIGYKRHTLMAVLAGLKMQQRVGENYPWLMRVGIATGQPIVGLIGHKRQSYTALGDTVNLASRIEEASLPGKVTIDEATYRAVERFLDAEPRVLHTSDYEENPELKHEIGQLLGELEHEGGSENHEHLKRVGLLLMEDRQPSRAREYLRRAMSLNPADLSVKTAFADCDLQEEQLEKIGLEGKQIKQRLYEVVGVKDPLLDRERVPQALYDRFGAEYNALEGYPEEMVLPVECLDGSIGHARLVGFLVFALATHIKFSEQERDDFVRAAWLADIGKEAIPHHLLNREGPLSQDEFEEVRKHPREGVQLLKNQGWQDETLFELILASHERLDGNGYPEGIGGRSVSLGARVIAIADGYAALTSWRPYRDPWVYNAALQELAREAEEGKYDKRIVAFLGELLGATEES